MPVPGVAVERRKTQQMGLSSQMHASYARPESLDEAVRLLGTRRWLPLAGGTDVFAAHVGRPLPAAVLDLSAVPGLRGILDAPGPSGEPGWRIGALTTWSEIARATLPSALQALGQAAREIGGVQIQNRGTIGGNVCNASPAADGVPVLAALDAIAELTSAAGVRRMPVSQFVLGPRRVDRRADELLTGFWLPRRSAAACSRFLKLGQRRYLVISIAMVAIALDFDQHDRTSSCGIAVGACSPVARRLPSLEAALLTTPRAELGDRAETLVNAAALSPLSPIDDVRATAGYRFDAVAELLVRTLSETSLREAA